MQFEEKTFIVDMEGPDGGKTEERFSGGSGG